MEKKNRLSNSIIGLALSSVLLTAACAPSKPINKPRKAVVAKIRTVLGPEFFNCFSSRKERDKTAEDRCSTKAPIKKYRDRSRSHCFSCRPEKEIIE